MENVKIDLVPMPQKAALRPGRCQSNARTVQTIDETMPTEAYKITLSENEATIRAGSAAGRFYAEKTLEQLRFRHSNGVPCMEIEDAPRYPYRSFHIDTARHFVPVEELERMIDAAASFKLNKFHWHFSNDQGWRIESKVFPLLHQIGAKRRGDHMGIGNSDAEEHLYYTQQQVRKIVKFCAERHVEVVPEVDMPGHVSAILAAYPQLSCTGERVETQTTASIFPYLLCPGKEETFQWIFALLDELCELFPGRYFHIGGDETPKTMWEACPDCRARMAAANLADSRQLQGWMTNRIAEHLRKKGKRTIVWNEAALGGNLDPDIIVQVWNDDPKDPSLKALSKEKDANGKPTSPNQGISAKLLRAGNELIVSNMMGSYCDYPYAFISTKKIYEWPIIPQKCEALQREAQTQIIGLECLLWTEHIRSAEALEHMAWPRFAAKAERAWRGETAPGYAGFAKRLKALYGYLTKLAPGTTPPSGWVPGPIRGAGEMLRFMKNYSTQSRATYRAAQSKV